MSLLSSYSGVGRAYMRIAFSNNVNYSLAGVTSQVITPSSTPVAGNMQIIVIGGSQSRTITPPAGWTLVTRVSIGGTVGFMWKVATGSEPANYTVNLNASLGGGAAYFELANADTSDPIAVHIGNQGTAVTSLNVGNYTAGSYGFAIALLAKSSTGIWAIDNSFSNQAPGSQFYYAVKGTLAASTGNTANWTGPSEDVATDLFFIRSKYV